MSELDILFILEKIDFLVQRRCRHNSRHGGRRNFMKSYEIILYEIYTSFQKMLDLRSKISFSGPVPRYGQASQDLCWNSRVLTFGIEPGQKKMRDIKSLKFWSRIPLRLRTVPIYIIQQRGNKGH